MADGYNQTRVSLELFSMSPFDKGHMRAPSWRQPRVAQSIVHIGTGGVRSPPARDHREVQEK